MDREFQDAAWYQALALAERIELGAAGQSNKEFDANLAERRLKKWRSQAPFDSQDWWQARLAVDSLTEEEFRYLLGEPAQSLRQRCQGMPSWLADLCEAFDRPQNYTPTKIELKELQPVQDSSGFLYAVEPLVTLGRERLRQGIEALIAERARSLSALPFDPNSIETVLFANLPVRLLQILSRTMALELNIARLQGLLGGETPAERFASFLQRLKDRNVQISLLREYPVLARQLATCTQCWVAASLEFLQRLCADWEEIRALLTAGRDPGVLVRFSDSAGDRHWGGRAVSIAEFSTGFQVVYKPKSLEAGVHFQELLTWVNQQERIPPFPTLKILARGEYGWVEFVTASSCSSKEEIQKFYQRLGGYLALLYALEAADFHYENLIAAGENPILIDLESLFHPRLKSDSLNPFSLENPLENSVLRAGLLPQRLWASQEFRGVDLSGMGAAPGQLIPGKQPYWEGVATDEMRVGFKPVELRSAQNRPSLNGVPANALDFTEEIVSGFSAIYRLLLEQREELLSAGGSLEKFAASAVRVLVRPTRTYALLLRESSHPDVLRNALDRDRLFDRLWVDVQDRPETAKVLPAERLDLWRGDIPMFVTRANSRDLWASDSRQIADFAAESGMERAQRRLQELDEKDLERQIWFIRASLATLAMEGEQIRWPAHTLPEPQPVPGRQQLLAAACAVADRLELLAVRGGSSVSWVGLIAASKGCWSLAPLGLNLYDGVPGIALFLAYLGEITAEERYRALAKAAAGTVLAQIASGKAAAALSHPRLLPVTSIGGFIGWGGVIYALTHLAALWDSPELLAEAVELVELLPPMIEADEHLDIFYGAAGGICSLLGLYGSLPEDRILDIATLCGDRLIACAHSTDAGMGWVSKGVWKAPLAGFSHGAAGIALALLELAAKTGLERFRAAAVQAIAYERSLFCPALKNWPDLRELETPVRTVSDRGDRNIFATTWAQGAPGIGLARLHSLPYLDDGEIRQEINTAIATTIQSGFGLNHSLGTGDLGSLELLLQASITFDDRALQSQVSAKAALILESIRQHGWICGAPFGVETPGLINGLAGTGYGFLRLAAPDRAGSVLVLAPPHNLGNR